MKVRVRVWLGTGLVLALVGTASNTANGLEGRWDDRFGFPDFNRTVYAVAVAPSGVYVGGAFGGNPQLMRLERMARWDGRAWSGLGGAGAINGAGDAVRAMAVIGADVYLAGEFPAVIDDTLNSYSVDYIVRYDGVNWHRVGNDLGYGVEGQVYALATDGTNLYVGGRFYAAGGQTATSVARWDGAAWSALGEGLGDPDGELVTALAVGPDGAVYAGGTFTRSGGVPIRRLARWNGVAWVEVGGGVDGQVHALAVRDGDLYVGGVFAEVGGNPIPRLARWDGTSWWEVDGGIRGGDVFAITKAGDELIVGGSFTDAGTVAANGIAQWNGLAWSSFGGGMSGGHPTSVRAVAVEGETVYAVGDFLQAGDARASRVALWDGVEWSELTRALGYPDRVNAIAVGRETVYVGGVFPSAGGAPANNIASWTGSEWHSLGSGLDIGLDGAVDAIAVDSLDRVYVGGSFSMAGGAQARHLAWWNGEVWAPMSTGVEPGRRVLAMAAGPDDSIYAGGSFDHIGGVPVNNLARWDGSEWHDVGGGVIGGNVATIVVRGTDVWVGGAFEGAGGVPAPGIARWDGTAWSALGAGIWNLGQRAAVHGMAWAGNDLFVGGEFRYAGGLLVNHVARWDGQGWHALGPGLEGQANALAMLGDQLFVGGRFSYAEDDSILDLASWDGSDWSSVGGGLGGWPTEVLALASQRTNLYVGGLFGWAGDVGASRFARWSVPHDPPLVTVVTPVEGSVFEMGEDILIRAEWLGGDSPITDLRFYANGALLATLESAPYELWWLEVFPDEYELTVEATDTLGVKGVSAPVTIEVLTPAENLPPEVVLVHPSGDVRLHLDEGGIVLEADATDPDGTILRVDFYANQQRLGSVASSPYTLLWTDLEPGVFLVWARAIDHLGGRSDSESVRVTVLPPNQPPVVTWMGPEDSSFHAVPGGIRLSAMASDSDGEVVRLEFRANDRLLVSLAGPGPFEYDWLDAEPGYYLLTATATDDGGRSAGNSVVILAVDANAPPVTRTTPLDEPRLDFWVPDGQVNAVAESGGTVYIGGAFTHVGQQVPGSAVLELTADAIDLSYPQVDGLVSVIFADGEGGYYIGGLFNSIGGIARTNLARVRADKTVDLTFEVHTSGYVLALALHGDELIVGGEFSRIHGVDRWGLASVNRLTGELSDWDPGVNSHVNTLLIADDRLYVGGQFNQIGGQPQANLAALDLETRAVLPWNPMVDGSVTQIVPSGDLVYLVGSFFHVNQARRNGLAAVTRDTGETTSFNHLAQSRAHQLLVAGGLVYVAGGFNRIAGVDRNNLAAIDPVTGQATDWHPDVGGTITAMALRGDTLFIAGSFGAVGGVPRFRLAGVTTNTPPVVSDLDLNASGRIFALGEVNGKILGGGPLGLVRIHRPALAALDVATGAATAWEPGCNGTVHSLAVADGRLLVGGAFSELKGQRRHGLGAFDLATGELLDWNPMVGGAALALAVRDRTVHVGGAFVEFGGQPRHHLAAVDLLSGELTPWNPQANEQVTAIALGDGVAYAGGNFNRIGGLTRRHLAALDLDTGLATAWDPSPDLPVLTIAVERDTVYVGGAFRTVGGRTRNSLAALDVQSGQATPWAAYPDSSVLAIVSANHLLYVGGGFEEIGGRIRPALAALNPRLQTPNALDWTPAPWSDLQPATIRAMAASSSALFVGGRFEVAGGEPRSNFAVFDLPTRIDQATMPVDGIFRLNLVGPLGRVYVFEASTNLVDWSPILTNRAPFLVEDREALTRPQRFYRAVPAR